MSFARYFTAAALALGVTLGLILVMHILIQTNIEGPGDVVEFRVPDIVMPEREMEVEYDTSKPDKPEEAEQQPPEIPKPEFDAPQATSDVVSVAAPTTEKPTIGGLSTMDGDMIPLSVPEPEYPRRAAQQGTEGFCVAVFTVSAQGTTKDVVLGECPDPVFERSTLKAAEKLKFKPKIVDGVSVDVPNQAYKYVYRLAKE